MPDICAAVSSVTYTGVNIINNSIQLGAVDFIDNGDHIELIVKSRKKQVKQAFDIMLQMYKDIQEQAPHGCVEVIDLDEES